MAFFARKRFSGNRREKTIPDGLWLKCPGCGQTVYRDEVVDNLNVCPHCGHHNRMPARERIAALCDPDSFTETHVEIESADPLAFHVGEESYAGRLERAKAQTGLREAMITGRARIEDVPVVLGVMDSSFIMASMGSALGEKFCRLAEDAIARREPLLVVAASGGARMQEGILALLQMAKTADAVRRVNEAGIPYVVVLTDPTSGGVFASFASLGDIVIAEPKAYIGFAGARLIEGALKVKLPDGFQRAEYQFENGFVDDIVKRHDLRPYLGRLLRYLHPNPEIARGARPAGGTAEPAATAEATQESTVTSEAAATEAVKTDSGKLPQTQPGIAPA
jgi:acetyl-CoA carboxylase carboxyl transferase subunit beta